MTLFPKKRPWIILVILYAAIIAGWVTFIMLAKQRHTSRLSPEQADKVYRKTLEESRTQTIEKKTPDPAKR